MLRWSLLNELPQAKAQEDIFVLECLSLVASVEQEVTPLWAPCELALLHFQIACFPCNTSECDQVDALEPL